MKTFYDKDDYTIEDVLSLIQNHVEESIYLDFKEAGALEKSERKRTDISKDVASFANSDGGIIVYGIKEHNHIACELSFIDGNEFTKEWLEQVINSSVQRNIPDIKIYPIRQDGDIRKTVYIVRIPFSLEAPHISKDNRYYKRYNFLALPMEEYEVRQTYDRKRKAKLFLATFGHLITYENNRAHVSFEINVTNEGMIVESDYKVNFYLIGINNQLIVSWPEREQNQTTYMEKGRVKISSVGKAPIFPEETVNGLRFNMKVELDEIESALSNTSFEIKLFYSGGEDSMEGDFIQLKKSLAMRE